MDHLFRGAGAPSKGLQADLNAYLSPGAERPADVRSPSDCPIWPENMPAVELFLRCSTQWRSHEPNHACGLDYGVVFKMASLYLDPALKIRDVLEDVQVMELRALELIAERRGSKPEAG